MKLTRIAQLGCRRRRGPHLAGCSSAADTRPPRPPLTSSDVKFTIDPSLSGTITAGGRPQSNAQTAWTTAYIETAKNVTINYDKSQGSGGGVTYFLIGAYDFAGSDSPLNADQTAQSKALCTEGGVNIPIYLDGVAIIFNIPGVTELKPAARRSQSSPCRSPTGPTRPSPRTTAPRWRGAIYGRRSDGSGTTQSFTNYLSATQPSVWTYAAGRTGGRGQRLEAEGRLGRRRGRQGGTGTIGYADHSAIGTLNAASIVTDGTAVAYSGEAVSATFGPRPSPRPTA